MKLLLLSANTTMHPYPVYPLGPDRIAGALARRHEVEILDMTVLGDHGHL